MTDRTTIDRVAQEMQAEAFCIGMVKESWRNLSPESQDGWRMIATAGILALRDTVGPTVIAIGFWNRRRREREPRRLLRAILAEFFRQSFREDAVGVADWLAQGGTDVDEFIAELDSLHPAEPTT